MRKGNAAWNTNWSGCFAGWLGVDFKLTLADSRAGDYRPARVRDRRTSRAAGLTRSLAPGDPLAFGPGFQWVTRQVVYRHGYIRTSSLAEIAPHRLHVTPNALTRDELDQLQDLSIRTWVLVMHEDKDDLELLEMIEYGEILYAVAWSNEVAYSRISLPGASGCLRPVRTPNPWAWAVRRSVQDDSLIRAIRQFHDHVRSKRQLADLTRADVCVCGQVRLRGGTQLHRQL